ncbi:hypothetical protein CAPTEDRAFT_205408, partial [Capitella teleta]
MPRDGRTHLKTAEVSCDLTGSDLDQRLAALLVEDVILLKDADTDLDHETGVDARDLETGELVTVTEDPEVGREGMITTILHIHTNAAKIDTRREAEQKRLELEMQKRRERIEQWRAERKKESLPPLQITPPSKVWSLEDDDEVDEEDEEDEKEEDAEVKKEEPTAEEVDPLDAYMQEVTTEVTTKKCVVENSSSNGNNGDSSKKGKVTIITAVAKKKNPIKQKGELMIDNADALE